MGPENQVVPFSLKTCDDETLYAWHILPLPLYSEHEASLIEGGGFCSDITKTENFRLLREDAESKLIIYCRTKFAALSPETNGRSARERRTCRTRRPTGLVSCPDRHVAVSYPCY